MRAVVSSYQAIKDNSNSTKTWYNQMTDFIKNNQERCRNMVSFDFGNMTIIGSSIDVNKVCGESALASQIIAHSTETQGITNYFYATKNKKRISATPHYGRDYDIITGTAALGKRKSTKKNKNILYGDSVKQILFKDRTDSSFSAEYSVQYIDGKPYISNGENHLDPTMVLEQTISEYIGKFGFNGSSKNVRPIQETEIVLTHPSGYGGERIQKYKEHVKGMGFRSVYTCPESTAACYQIVIDEHQEGSHHEKDRIFFIVDIGHGTTDLTVCQVCADGSVNEVCCAGDTALGGKDFTRAIAEDIFSIHSRAVDAEMSEKEKKSDTTQKLTKVNWKGWETVTSKFQAQLPIIMDRAKTIKEALCNDYSSSVLSPPSSLLSPEKQSSKYADTPGGSTLGESDDSESDSSNGDLLTDNECTDYHRHAERLIREKEKGFSQSIIHIEKDMSVRRQAFEYRISYDYFRSITKEYTDRIRSLIEKVLSKCRDLLGENFTVDKVVNIGGGSKIPELIDIEREIFGGSHTAISQARCTSCVSSGALFKAISDCIEDEVLCLPQRLPALSMKHETETMVCNCEVFGSDRGELEESIRGDLSYSLCQSNSKRRAREIWYAIFKTVGGGYGANPFILPGTLLPSLSSSTFSIIYDRETLSRMKQEGTIDTFIIASHMVDQDESGLNYKFRDILSEYDYGLPLTYSTNIRDPSDSKMYGSWNFLSDGMRGSNLRRLLSDCSKRENPPMVNTECDIRGSIPLEIPFDELLSRCDWKNVAANIYVHAIDNDKFVYFYTYAYDRIESVAFNLYNGAESVGRVVYSTEKRVLTLLDGSTLERELIPSLEAIRSLYPLYYVSTGNTTLGKIVILYGYECRESYEAIETKRLVFSHGGKVGLRSFDEMLKSTQTVHAGLSASSSSDDVNEERSTLDPNPIKKAKIN